jgi:hypothetical protein
MFDLSVSLLPVQREILRHGSFLAQSQNLIQIVRRSQLLMQILDVGRQ